MSTKKIQIVSAINADTLDGKHGDEFALAADLATLVGDTSVSEQISEAIQQNAITPDWEQNDETAKDYIRNRPFYTSDPIETVVIDDTIIVLDDESGTYTGVFTIAVLGVANQMYRIVLNSIEYESVSVAVPEGLGMTGVFIGNQGLIDMGEDTGEPYIIFLSNDENNPMGMIMTLSPDDITLTISTVQSEIIKIPDKYLPKIIKVYNLLNLITPSEDGQQYINADLFDNVASEFFSGNALLLAGNEVVTRLWKYNDVDYSICTGGSPLDYQYAEKTNIDGVEKYRLFIRGSSNAGTVMHTLDFRALNNGVESQYGQVQLATWAINNANVRGLRFGYNGFFIPYNMSAYEPYFILGAFECGLNKDGTISITDPDDITRLFHPLPSFTTADNNKVLGIENGALVWDKAVEVDSVLDSDSTNPVQNKVITDFLTTYVGDTPVATQISEEIKKIDFPVDSVNGKTGAVQLTASDVGALPDTTVIPSIVGLATETYVDQKVAGVVNSAPEALNTLNELANALGDDPNFATTVATQIGDINTGLNTHANKKDNPHSVTKAQVGLGNVENKSSATIRGELTQANIQSALGYVPPSPYSTASNTTDGLMSKTDKAALDKVVDYVGDKSVVETIKDNLPTAGTDLGLVKSGGDVSITGGVITVNDNSHAHTIANVTGLQAALDGKAAEGHTHSGYVNKNAFSKVVVGSTTVQADTVEDTLTLVAGSNVTLTPDATNDKITIAAIDTKYTHPDVGTAGTYLKVTTDAQGHVKSGATTIGMSEVDGLSAELAKKALQTDLQTLSDRVGDDLVSEQIATELSTFKTTYVDKKVDKADGKGLSTNDYTTNEKNKLSYTNIAYGTCTTGAATAAKVITVSGNTNWALTAGSRITIKFTNTNTASNPTFNVNGKGAKSVWYNTALITTSNLGYAGTANRPMDFVYDGTQFVFIGWSVDSNTTYTNASLGQGYGTCATAEATTEKAVTLSGYTLVVGGIVAVKFTYAVPASAKLNVNSKGAKAIYYKGAVITAGVIKAGDTATFIYDGTQYRLLTVDRDDNTTYSIATSDTAGLVKIGYAENGKNYPVELSNGQMFVNVPWSQRGIQDNLTSTSTTDSLSANQGKVLDGKITDLEGLVGDTSVATQIANTAVKKTGDTMTGTLVLSKTTDLSGTANNSPALIVGGTATSTHMEFDANEIQAKSNGTTATGLYINNDGGLVTVGSGGLAVNGQAKATTFNVNSGVTVQYDSTNKCLDFVFA